MADSEEIFDPKVGDEPIFVDPNLLRPAVERCKERLAANPSDRDVLRSLAELYRKLGKLEEAAATYGQVCDLDPLDQESAHLRALLAGAESPFSPTGMRPSPFVLVKDFLPRDFHDALIPFAIAHQDRFVLARVGRHAEYKPDVRQTLEFADAWKGGRRFRQYLATIPDVLRRLHLASVPLEMSVLRLRAYQNGHFFRAHIDAEPNTPSAVRAYNFVYYFHRMPRPYGGGELILFDTDPEGVRLTRSRFTCVVPEDNSIILFPCSFFHSVLPVRCPSGEFADSRFVINGIFSRRAEGQAGVDQTRGDVAAPD